MATYNTLTPEIIEQLKQAAPGHILTGEEINEDYSHDEMPIYGKQMPDALLMATSTEEIAAVMKICNDNLIPVTPRGAGTGLAGGCVPVLGGVLRVMSLNVTFSMCPLSGSEVHTASFIHREMNLSDSSMRIFSNVTSLIRALSV